MTQTRESERERERICVLTYFNLRLQIILQ